VSSEFDSASEMRTFGEVRKNFTFAKICISNNASNKPSTPTNKTTRILHTVSNTGKSQTQKHRNNNKMLLND